MVSHAAVVARGWGIPAVVGAGFLVVEHGITINDQTLKVGEQITIDGSTGEVFAGSLAGESEVVPEAATFLGWAREVGIPIPTTDSPETSMTQPAGTATPADALRLLLVKGYATPEQAADCLLIPPESGRRLFEQLVSSADAEAAVGAYRLTDTGKIRARMDLDAERASWPGAGEALDEFVGYDKQVKDVVTAWQMRGETINDHSDAAYDAGVLDRLTALHREIGEWLPARFARYAQRLDRAAAAVGAGDTKFIASPRVDSYHSAWFELHEELILLAGRTRADEVAAGRA